MLTINSIGTSEFVTNTSRNNIYYGIYSANTECYYGFTIKSLDNLSEKTFLLKDISPASQVFNLFRITGTTGTEILSNGVVDLRPSGMYEYNIYSVTGNTINDIDTSCNLEVGLIKII